MNVLVKGYRILKRTRKNTLLGPVYISSVKSKIYNSRDIAEQKVLIKNLCSGSDVAYSVVRVK